MSLTLTVLTVVMCNVSRVYPYASSCDVIQSPRPSMAECQTKLTEYNRKENGIMKTYRDHLVVGENFIPTPAICQELETPEGAFPFRTKASDPNIDLTQKVYAPIAKARPSV